MLMHMPWGKWQMAPMEWPRECTMPTMELEKAMPAMVEAWANSRRPCASFGLSITASRLRLIFWIAAVA